MRMSPSPRPVVPRGRRARPCRLEQRPRRRVPGAAGPRYVFVSRERPSPDMSTGLGSGIHLISRWDLGVSFT